MIDALLAAIDEEPDDEARYLVLADALTAAGDPRGELIVLQHALAKNPYDRELVRAEQIARRARWPELAKYRIAILDATWRLGFVDELSLDGNHVAVIGDAVRTACETESTRHVRKLHARTWAERDGDPIDLTGLSNLRTLVIERAEGWKDRDLASVVARLPKLTSITVGDRAFSAETIASLPQTLRGFGVRYMWNFVTEHVVATARLPLRALSLYKVGVTDGALAHIGDTVRDLEIDQCRELSARFVRQLASHTLERLRIATWNAGIDGAELRHLAGTLEHLEVYSVANGTNALAAIADQPRMRTLELSDFAKAPIDAATFERVLTLPDLRRLLLRCDGGIEGKTVGEPSGVEHLQLYVGSLAPSIVAQLPRMSLRRVDVRAWQDINPWVDNTTLAMLADCALLEELNLGGTAISDAGLRSLRAATRLTNLALGHCTQVGKEAIELARALPALRALNLDSTNVRSFAGLANHPTLAELDLSGLSLSSADLESVATIPNLRSLRMRQATIRDIDLSALLPAASALRRLDLEQCQITKAATGLLGEFRALEELNLRSTPMGEGGVRSLHKLREALPYCRIDW